MPPNPTRRRALKRVLAAAAVTLPARSLRAAAVGRSTDSDPSAMSAKALGSAAEAILESASRLGRGKSLSLLLPQGSEANLGPLLSLFAERTGATLKPRYVPVDDINTYLLLSNAGAATRFDVGLPASFGLTDLVEAGAVRALDDYVERWEPEGFRDGYTQQASGHWRGAFYGYQTDGDMYLGFLNRAVLAQDQRDQAFADRYGRPATRLESWAHLDELMAFYHAPSAQRYGGCLFRIADYAVWEFWLRFHANGALPFDADMRPQIQTEPGVRALDALIRSSQLQNPNSRAASLFENWETFKGGQCLVNIGWGGSQKAFQALGSPIRDQVQAFEPPAGAAAAALPGMPYFNWGWNYTVASYSAQPELAYLFTLFASSPAASTLAVRQQAGYFDPFRAEHYADPMIEAAYSRDFLHLHQRATDHCLPDCHIGGQADYFSALGRFISLAIDGKLSAEDALVAVSSRWQGLTERRGRTLQAEAWAQVRARYPRALLLSARDGL